MITPLAIKDVVWRPTRPNITISHLRGTSTNRGYHENDYEIVSRRELSDEDLKHLDACGLLGIGQAYHVTKREAFEEETPAVYVDRLTGNVLPGEPINEYSGQPYKKTAYTYHRCIVRRICDSGD